jgi:hypothetical protein
LTDVPYKARTWRGQAADERFKAEAPVARYGCRPPNAVLSPCAPLLARVFVRERA